LHCTNFARRLFDGFANAKAKILGTGSNLTH
jgi:hypothetical protein